MNTSVNNVDNTQNIELNRNELLRLLSLLEGKLQGNEITIAALKADRLRRLFYPTIINKKKIDKINRNSVSYATIIPSNKQTKAEKTEEIYDNKYDNFNEDINQNNLIENDEKENSLLTDEYKQYVNELNTNPYLSLANDLNFADDLTTNESLIKKVHNGRVIAIKDLIRIQRDVTSYLENQLEIVTSELNKVKLELSEEKEKNIKFKRDETLREIEKLQSEKKTLENEISCLKKELEDEKEREKIMVVYLLAERKQLIIKLIEEKDYNIDLKHEIVLQEQMKEALEEDLEEESKRSLQMEIDLESLTNRHEIEKTELENKLKNLEEKNLLLSNECESLKKKLNELVKTNVNTNSNNINNNSHKNSVDLGEGVRSTIVTFNNAIANFAESTVISSQRQAPTVVQSAVQAKPVLSSKPSLNKTIVSNNRPNGKAAVTIINTKNFNNSSEINSSREVLKNNENFSALKQNSVNDKNSNNNQSNDNSTKNFSQISKTTSTSVASVIQKFSNSTVSNKNSNAHPPLVKKISSTGLVANIAQNITQQANRGPPPPVPPNKPILNSSLIKDRTAKIFEQSSSGSQ